MMQAALCAALAASVALAWWVGRNHAAALAVKLDEPRSFPSPALSLDLSLPVGWKTKNLQLKGSPAVLAVEEPPRYGTQRKLIVVVKSDIDFARGSASGDAEKVASFLVGRSAVGAPRTAQMLEGPGFIFEYPVERREKVPGVVKELLPQLVACTVVAGPHPVAVCVILTGVKPLAPADFEALKRVAQALKRSDPAHPVPLVPDTLEEPKESVNESPGPRQEPPGDPD